MYPEDHWFFLLNGVLVYYNSIFIHEYIFSQVFSLTDLLKNDDTMVSESVSYYDDTQKGRERYDRKLQVESGIFYDDKSLLSETRDNLEFIQKHREKCNFIRPTSSISWKIASFLCFIHLSSLFLRIFDLAVRLLH